MAATRADDDEQGEDRAEQQADGRGGQGDRLHDQGGRLPDAFPPGGHLLPGGHRLAHGELAEYAQHLGELSRLAAISLAGHPDPERFVAEFSGSERTVAEHLLAEMLDRQPPEVQDLLLRTSILDRVNGELADVLTGRPGSERILLELEDANAFVESLDPGADQVSLPPPVRGFPAAGVAPQAARGSGHAAPAGCRVVHRAGPGGRGRPAHAGGDAAARRSPSPSATAGARNR
jgi:hypothetical protein